MSLQKKLKIQLIKQPKNSNDCGVACVAMIANYYNLQLKYQDIKNELGVYSWGTTTPQLGLFFLHHGFNVEIVGLHPALFQSGTKFSNQSELMVHLKKMKKVLKDGCDPVTIDHFIKFVKDGGKITPRIPIDNDIETELTASRPVLVPLSHWFLHKTKMLPRFSVHFNVVCGMNKNNFTVNDPDFGNDFGGAHDIEKKLLMYSIYVSAKGGIDDACIMKISQR